MQDFLFRIWNAITCDCWRFDLLCDPFRFIYFCNEFRYYDFSNNVYFTSLQEAHVICCFNFDIQFEERN